VVPGAAVPCLLGSGGALRARGSRGRERSGPGRAVTLGEVRDQWRADAEILRRRGCEEAARLLESCAGDLDACLAVGDGETLSLAEAARESGYSAGHLRWLIGQGRLRDVAQSGPARVRRGDLPRKPGHVPAAVRRAA